MPLPQRAKFYFVRDDRSNDVGGAGRFDFSMRFETELRP